MPAEGDPVHYNPYGGFHNPCTYTCAGGIVTVFTGDSTENGYVWRSDGACDHNVGGAGGSAEP
jgi:hypothetical protein